MSQGSGDPILPNSNVFTGLNDKQREGDFRWPDGSKLMETRPSVVWQDAKPDKAGDCVYLSSSNGEFVDGSCTGLTGYSICQKNLDGKSFVSNLFCSPSFFLQLV